MLLQRLTVPSGIRSSLSSLSSLSFKASSASAFTRCSPYSTQPEATPKKVSDPLRILFCGSDVFSCYSLKALHAEHKANPGLIKSIDVMVRPGKAVGRGYKEIRQGTMSNTRSKLLQVRLTNSLFSAHTKSSRRTFPAHSHPRYLHWLVSTSNCRVRRRTNQPDRGSLLWSVCSSKDSRSG